MPIRIPMSRSKKIAIAGALALVPLSLAVALIAHRELTQRAAAESLDRARAAARTTAQAPILQSAPSPSAAYWIRATLRSLQLENPTILSARVVDGAGTVRARVDGGKPVPNGLAKPLPQGTRLAADVPGGGTIELLVRPRGASVPFAVDAAAALALAAAALLAATHLPARRRRAEPALAQETGGAEQLARDLPHAGEPLLVVLAEVDGLDAYANDFGPEAARTLLDRLAHRVTRAAMPGRAYHVGDARFALLISAGNTARVIANVKDALTESGGAFLVEPSIGFAGVPADAPTAEAALALAEERLTLQRGWRHNSVGWRSADALLGALEARDPRIVEHLTDVGDLAELVGAELGMRGVELERLGQAAELHDIGKVAVPDALLSKPGPLDEEEWALVREHPAIGERIVAAAPALAGVAPIVRASHERWDGTGYPDGLLGEEIPLAARIVAVCTAWQSLTSERPYREAVGDEQAAAELRAGAGTQFDPQIVETFCRVAAGAPRQVSARIRLSA